MTAIGKPTFQQNFSAALAEARLRLLNISRYPGQLMMEVIIPIVIAAMPILLGRATAGDDAAANFASNTGTTNYVAFLLIGSNVFTIVSQALWHVGHWIRFEQETGTLEAVYLTPTRSLTLASGVALYSITRALIAAFLSYVLGCIIFAVNPFQGNLPLALVFIFVGLIPLYSLTFLFGALVLKVKESNALIGLMQWVVSFFMGIFFPVLVMPPLLRTVSLLFPPTWMVNGVRSSLLGVGYFFETWYADLAVLGSFILVLPLFSFWVFSRTERNIRMNEGIGEF